MAFWDYFFKKKSDSASHAVDRIKFVLQSDRTGLPPETLERIKNDIVSVLSKYVDIDTAELDFNITKAPSESGALTPALCANIPIKGVKRNAPQPEVKKAEVKPEVKTETKPEAKPEIKTEDKPEEKKAEVKPEAKPEEKKADEKPEVKPEAKSEEKKAEEKPEVKTEIISEIKTESKL